jgi:hypothetical protein
MSYENSFHRDFVFLDGLGTACHKKEIRSYLSREGHRKKKIQDANLSRSGPAPVGWRESIIGTVGSMDANPVSRDIQSMSPKEQGRECSSSRTPSLPSPVSPKYLQHYSTAASLLTAIERDLIHFGPFTTLPVTLDDSGEVLASLAISIFLESSPSWASAKFTDAVSLHLAFLHKPIFCSMLAAASTYMDSVSGNGVSLQTTRWTLAGSHYVSQLLSDPESRYGDDALVGSLSLLNAEILAGNRESFHVHSRGFAQILRNRGGLRSLQGSHSIDMFVSFLLITPAGKGQIAYLDQIQPDAAGITELKDWALNVDLLLATLQSLAQWDPSRCPNIPDTCDRLKDLLQMLARAGDEFEESQQFFIHLYLAVTRWQYRKNSEAFTDLLRRLAQKFVPGTSLADVTWFLIQGLDADRVRKWQVVRMVKVLHRLKRETALHVKQFLCGLTKSNFHNTQIDMLTGDDFVKIRYEALAGLPINAMNK